MSAPRDRARFRAHLALVCGLTRKRLNEQVTRNQERSPADLMFHPTRQEKAEVVANCDCAVTEQWEPQPATDARTWVVRSVQKGPTASRLQGLACKTGSSGRTRTCNLVVNSHPLCRLSYRGAILDQHAKPGNAIFPGLSRPVKPRDPARSVPLG